MNLHSTHLIVVSFAWFCHASRRQDPVQIEPVGYSRADPFVKNHLVSEDCAVQLDETDVWSDKFTSWVILNAVG